MITITAQSWLYSIYILIYVDTSTVLSTRFLQVMSEQDK